MNKSDRKYLRHTEWAAFIGWVLFIISLTINLSMLLR